jgi:ABC-2 type transport system ATP-binding protein
MMKSEPAGEPAVRVEGLHVVRGARVVIPDLSLAVPRGQVVGLLGPSGCGKSTLMRSVVGVQKVAGGTITVLGRPAGDRRLRDRVGYLTQAPSVYDDLTVAENLAYFATVVGVARSGRDAEVARILALVSLTDHADARVDRLSGSPSGPPWSARPSCWCSTSRRSGSTPCSAATSGRCSAGSRARASRSW